MSWKAEQFPSLRHEAHFGDRIVACFKDRPTHFHQILADSAACFPDSEALVMGEERLTWREVAVESERLARALAALGVGKGRSGPDDPL